VIDIGLGLVGAVELEPIGEAPAGGGVPAAFDKAFSSTRRYHRPAPLIVKRQIGEIADTLREVLKSVTAGKLERAELDAIEVSRRPLARRAAGTMPGLSEMNT
jgi:hypothetical protein